MTSLLERILQINDDRQLGFVSVTSQCIVILLAHQLFDVDME